jgi:toxin ParE1/3/4
MKYKIIWSKDAGDEFTEIISWYKYNAGKNAAQKIYTKIDL